MSLDLSQFKSGNISVSEEQYKQWKMDSEKKRLNKNGTYPMVIKEVKEVQMCANDPKWVQAKFCMETPEGTAEKVVQFPCTATMEYGQKATRFVIVQTIEFLKALGFVNDTHINTFFNKIVATNAEILQSLQDFRVNYTIEWSANSVHLEYDFDGKVSYLHRADGVRWTEIPFAGDNTQATRAAQEVCNQSQQKMEAWPKTTFTQDTSAKNPIVAVLQQGPTLVIQAPPAVNAGGGYALPPTPAIVTSAGQPQTVNPIVAPANLVNTGYKAPPPAPSMLSKPPVAPSFDPSALIKPIETAGEVTTLDADVPF